MPSNHNECIPDKYLGCKIYLTKREGTWLELFGELISAIHHQDIVMRRLIIDEMFRRGADKKALNIYMDTIRFGDKMGMECFGKELLEMMKEVTEVALK